MRQTFFDRLLSPSLLLQALHAAIEAQGLSTHIQVDGGISDLNVADIARDGADCFVAGSAVFNNPRYPGNYARAIEAIRSAAAR